MKDYGIGDVASIKEIISEVDTDNVSFFRFINFKNIFRELLPVLMPIELTGWEDQL